MSDIDLPIDALLNETRNIAREAGDAIMEIYGTRFAAVEKDDHSPLTEADLAAHRIISGRLRELTPDLPLLSEEGREVTFVERQGWPAYWLVDPLDGTREFVKRNGEFTVNIALIQNHQPLLGVVWSPVLERMYSGARNLGAFRETSASSRAPIRVSERPPQSIPRVVGSRSHGSERMQVALTTLGPHELLPMGSSLKLCLVAEGAADLYPRLGPTSEWDTAAAHAIVTAAGGHVVDLSGRELVYNTRESLLNPQFLVCAGEPRSWLERLGLNPESH